MRVRRENREKSLHEMVQRTRQVSAGIAIRPNPNDPVRQSTKAEMPANLPKLRVGGRSKSGIRQSVDDGLQLMRNSQKYDEMMKGRKDELKRKRGALELNSDLDVDLQGQ